MFVTWSALELSEPSRSSPWLPTGAAHVQAGRGRAGLAVFDGLGGSVLAAWDEAPLVQDWPVEGAGLRAAWHVLLEPVSYRGDAWSETDPARRRALLQRAWAPDAVYCDPLDHVVGREALSAHIGAFQESIAGGSIAVTAEAVRHHDSAHFPWSIADATGATVLTGFDVVQLDEQGRITRLTGFFDA